jgi:hypothetical protein
MNATMRLEYQDDSNIRNTTSGGRKKAFCQ